MSILTNPTAWRIDTASRQDRRKEKRMRKRRNIAFAVLILAVLAALVLSLSACAEKQTKNALEP